MKVTELQGVQFSIQPQRNDEGDLMGVVLAFTDMRQLVPGTQPVPIEVIAVPFDADAWVNFKRHVEANGEVTPIAIARSVPKG